MDYDDLSLKTIEIDELDAQLAEMERLIISMEELAKSTSELSQIEDRESLILEAGRHVSSLFNPCLFGIYTEIFEENQLRVYVFNPALLKNQEEIEAHILKTLSQELGNLSPWDAISFSSELLWPTEPLKGQESLPKAWSIVPLRLKRIQSGVAFMASSLTPVYSKDYSNLFQLFISTLGSYLENLQLLDETKNLTLDLDEQLEERERLIITLEAAQESSQRISQTIEIEDLNREAASSIREIFGAQAWGYLEYSEASFTNNTPFRCNLYAFHPSIPLSIAKLLRHMVVEINKVPRTRFLLDSDISVEINKDFLSPESSDSQVGPYDTFVAHPMKAQDRLFGIAFMYADRIEAFSQDFLNLFYLLTRQFSATFENIRLFKKTEWYATYDTLTGLYNRRTFEELFQKQLARSRRTKSPFAICMIDIDFFKKFNDTYGHEVGDEVLRQVAGALKESLRINDVVARFGGEEFIAIFTDTNAEGASIVAERIRKKVENLEARAGFQALRVTISAGVAVYPDDGTTRDSLIENADQALYQAKNAGRNRVILFAQNPS
jgi:diguanylate cyclase (GGDEF)-like protein